MTRVAGVAPLLVTAVVFFCSPARGDATGEAKACSEAFVDAQTARDAHKLLRARELFISCARDSCPGALRTECFNALREVDASRPSVVLRAVDERGHDLRDVVVDVDGEAGRAHVDGSALFLDPGPHDVTFHSRDRAATTEHIVLGEGEHNRVVVAELRAKDVARADRATMKEERPPPRDRTLAFVTGLLGLGAMGIAGGLYVGGMNARSDCISAAVCDQDRVDTIRKHLLVADVFAAVGLVALGGSVLLFWPQAASSK